MGKPIAIRGNLWNLEIATPVVGELGGLIPRVNPTVLTSTNVANDPIEEELQLPVSMVPTSIHFGHHKSAKCRLGIVILRRLNLDKVVCVELTPNFCQFPLEWVGFSCKSGKNWSLVIGWSWMGVARSAVEYP